MVIGRVMLLITTLAALLLSSSAMGSGDVSPPADNACRWVVDPPDENCDPESCKASCSLRYHGIGVCDPVGCQCTYCHPPSPPPK
uniref:Knottin scorpion toxin-like domain-containing protein n=1 Tax=Oryza brachyantha TaxID=4533 RepID=J3LGP0_ORYBR